MDIKLFNKLVNKALADRNSTKYYERASLIADAELGVCILRIHTFNGVYTESPIGHWLYSYDNNQIVKTWCNNG